MIGDITPKLVDLLLDFHKHDEAFRIELTSRAELLAVAQELASREYKVDIDLDARRLTVICSG